VIHSPGFLSPGEDCLVVRSERRTYPAREPRSQDPLSDVCGEIAGARKPSKKVPLSCLPDVRYTPKKPCLEKIVKKESRIRAASTVETFAQTLRRVARSKRFVRHPGESRH